MFEGCGLASRSMTFPAAITVEGLFPQLSAASHMARTECATSGGGYGPGYTGNVATFRFGKVQPSSPSACRAAASRSVRHAS